jgi:uncharacterized protein YjbI with pentapeptide repeats
MFTLAAWMDGCLLSNTQTARYEVATWQNLMEIEITEVNLQNAFMSSASLSEALLVIQSVMMIHLDDKKSPANC